MPELPEVETIKNALANGGRGGASILGQRILRTDVLWDGTIQTPSVSEFIRQTENQVIQSLSRRAKYLQVQLAAGALVFHLRMSGDIRVEPYKEYTDPLQKHDRVVFWFANHQRLVFNNPRKFGRVWLLPDPQVLFKKLGPEPLDPSFTSQEFYEKLQKHQRQIKPLLMDQYFIAGLGNIYTDEALFLAGVHPLRNSKSLTQPETEVLLSMIRKVLTAGIERNGSSIDWAYRGGEFQNEFQVYGRKEEACYQCGTAIRRIVVGQRGTHYCPQCQKLDDL